MCTLVCACMPVYLCACACVHACVRACVRACVPMCVYACVDNISVDNNPEVTGFFKEIALVLYVRVITTTFYSLSNLAVR